jgi:serine phosphatase RsbU (regulator of sigma subunit)
MGEPHEDHDDTVPDRLPASGDGALAALLSNTADVPAHALHELVDHAGTVLGAASTRLLVADYALASLLELGDDGPTGERLAIDGSLAGRAFATGELVTAGDDPTVACVPVADGSERLGVLELTAPTWDGGPPEILAAVVRVLVLAIVSKRRYTDVGARSRRTQPLAMAAEMQWDLLPPLACTTGRVSVSGILEPAYAIGGDSFDYAVNPGRVEFAIVDAVGHGMEAVLLSVAAINALRNTRREGGDLETGYHQADDVLRTQFGRSSFVTGQTGSLDTTSGELTWINAGHPLPLLVRDGSFVGELECRPSLPMGLGGSVVEMATVRLQPDDRVLFYSDGVTENRSAAGAHFGGERLADLLVRSTLDRLSPAETVRRLSGAVSEFSAANLGDDATLLLLQYHGDHEHRPAELQAG